MRFQIETYLSETPSKTIHTADLQERIRHKLGSEYFSQGGYLTLAKILGQLCEEGQLSPVKTSGFNERNQKLYNRYRKVTEALDHTTKLKLNTLDPRIDTAKYYGHPAFYEQDHIYLEAMDKFYKDSRQVATLNRSP